jgi:glycosyl transferase family 25
MRYAVRGWDPRSRAGSGALHVHFINLERSSDRLAEFRNVNSHLAETTRFPAVDGSKVDIASLAANGLATADILSMFRIGAVGVAMSNIALWDLAIQSGSNVTIAEDDAIFHRQFDRSAEQLIAGLPADWDLILWGWNFDLFLSFEMLPGVSLCLAQFEQDRLRANIGAFQAQSILPRAYRLRWAFGIPCYTVSAKGARALRSKCLPLRPMLIPCPEGAKAPPHAKVFRNVGIDNTMNSVYPELNAFVCFPPLVVVKNEPARSTIQAGGTAAQAERTQASPAQGVQAPASPAQGMQAEQAPHDSEAIGAAYREAVALHGNGRLPEALAEYEKVLALDPGNLDALLNLGAVHFDLGKSADALAAFDRVLTIAPANFTALNMRGLALESLQRPDDALAAYDKALAAAPGSIETMYNRANVLADLQRLEEALHDYDAVAAARPDFAPAFYNRALVLEQLGRGPEALACYEKVLALNPGHAAARENHTALRDELDRDLPRTIAAEARLDATTRSAPIPAPRQRRAGAPSAATRRAPARSTDRTRYALKCSKCGKRGEMLVSESTDRKDIVHSLSKGFKHMPNRSNNDDLRIVCSTCQIEVRF